ncbi:centrosomal protein B [Nephila pilipes]|uniref:Centrosomal protein B n=1 Tax=Nephila pilipes TaxID=299642 RepID=A0A8X6PEM5_NEPPI|nr:centrosomal protein B [Nephila pilipes]
MVKRFQDSFWVITASAREMISHPSGEFSGREDIETTEPKEKKDENYLSGIGERDSVKQEKHPFSPSSDKLLYLLLDVRSKEEFLKNHLKTDLSHTHETNELRLYRNKREEIIIVYDDDGITAIRVVNFLVERGYDNIYLLSGGLNYALSVWPKGVVESVTVKNSKDYDIFVSHQSIRMFGESHSH